MFLSIAVCRPLYIFYLQRILISLAFFPRCLVQACRIILNLQRVKHAKIPTQQFTTEIWRLDGISADSYIIPDAPARQPLGAGTPV